MIGLKVIQPVTDPHFLPITQDVSRLASYVRLDVRPERRTIL